MDSGSIPDPAGTHDQKPRSAASVEAIERLLADRPCECDRCHTGIAPCAPAASPAKSNSSRPDDARLRIGGIRAS